MHFETTLYYSGLSHTHNMHDRFEQGRGGAMTRTRHVDITEWVDFVRGLGGSADRAAKERHLASGCQRCQRIVRVLGGFAALAPIIEAGPTEQTLRRAEAIFPRRQPKAGFLPRLVFDSFREPLPVGIRAEDQPARHVLYQAGGYFLDLQLEREPASDVITLIGQLSDRQQPATTTGNLPVLLMAPEGPVASAMSNRVGEFQLDYKPARNLRLHILLQAVGGRIDVGLDRLSPATPRGAAHLRQGHESAMPRRATSSKKRRAAAKGRT